LCRNFGKSDTYFTDLKNPPDVVNILQICLTFSKETEKINEEAQLFEALRYEPDGLRFDT
jgi:hypothetical protein